MWGTWAGPLEAPAKGGERELKGRQALWAEFITEPTQDTFFEAVKDAAPYEYINNHGKLMEYARWAYKVKAEPYTPKFTEFPGLPLAMASWWEVEAKRTERPKALVVFGASRTGKTEWARSLGKLPVFFVKTTC